jgi:ABC-2 type transport system permease protein
MSNMSLRRMMAIVRKEMIHIRRDPRNLFLVTLSPAFLLLLLSHIFSFDATQLHLAFLDLDRTAEARAYASHLTSDSDLDTAFYLDSQAEIMPLLVAGEVQAVVIVPPGFANTLKAGKSPQVQAVIDGSDPLKGAQAANTLEALSSAFALPQSPGSAAGTRPIEVRTQALYNAGLQSLFSMVPGLLAIVLVMPTMAFALALTRERETGTLEGLFVTPISGLEYVGGKLLAYVGAGLVSALIALLVAVAWFKVPFRGSLLTFLGLTTVYFLACMGFTIIVALFVKSQQTAMFIVLIVFVVPSFFLAGLITPVSTTSLGAMLSSYALPSTHFVEIARVLFLKGLGVAYVLRPTLALLGMGLGSLLLGLLLFRKKIG